jgi:hypothetical protein
MKGELEIEMDKQIENAEFRWQLVKTMLDEHPELRDRVKAYVRYLQA